MPELHSTAARASTARWSRVMLVAAVCALLWTIVLSAMLARHFVTRKPSAAITAEQTSSAPANAPPATADAKREPERKSPMVAEPDRQTLAEAKARDTVSAKTTAATALPNTAESAVPAAMDSRVTASAQPVDPAAPLIPGTPQKAVTSQIAGPAAGSRVDAKPSRPPVADTGSVAQSEERASTRDTSVRRAPSSAAAAASASSAKARQADRGRTAFVQQRGLPVSRAKDKLASERARKADREAAARATAQLVNQAPRGSLDVQSSTAETSTAPPATPASDADSLESRRAAMLGLQPNTQRPPPPALPTPGSDRNIEPTRARLEQSWEQRERWLSEQLRRK